MPQISRPHSAEKLVLKLRETNGKRVVEGERTTSLFHFHLLLLHLLAPASPPYGSPSCTSFPSSAGPALGEAIRHSVSKGGRKGLIKGGWQCRMEPNQGGSWTRAGSICREPLWLEANSCIIRGTLENVSAPCWDIIHDCRALKNSDKKNWLIVFNWWWTTKLQQKKKAIPLIINWIQYSSAQLN